MPGPLAVGDRVMVTFRGTLAQQHILSTFWYGVSAITGVVNQTDAFTALRASLVAGGGLRPDYLACCPTNYTLDYIWIQNIRPTRWGKFTFGDNSPGTWAADAPTANTSGVITRRGDLAIRKAVSTLHVPISSTADVMADGLLTPAFKTPMTALAVEVIKSITTAGTVVTYFPVIDNGPGGADFQVITSAFVQETARVMRRRTVGLGE